MLKPVIYTFLNFFYIDSLLLNVLYQVGAVLWDYYYTKDDLYSVRSIVAAIIDHSVQFAIGFAIAQLFRFVQRRFSFRSRHFFSVDLDHARPLIIAVLSFVSLTFYEHSIHDAFYSQADPYPIGATRSLLAYIAVLGLVELYEHFMHVPNRVFDNTSDNVHAMFVGIAVVAVDLLFFENGGSAIPLVAIAYFSSICVTSWLFKLALDK